MIDKSALRDAATVIVLRDRTSVLMGQRGSSAAFMPGKFVFPGGAVDPGDSHVTLPPLNPTCENRLQSESDLPATALTAAAIRELWEETSQILGTSGRWDDAPADWADFAKTGFRPDPSPLSFFFRAVTPHGRPRRFDARFFLADAAALASDPDDFSTAEDELSHLQWVPLKDTRRFDLPFITKVVLAELIDHIDRDGPITSVPFFRNDDEAHLISRLGHADPL
ncbi:MAG: NUDIX hydrolase [Yoonia sp.]|uniref:NUDIX hydrolase n=1 Tax=Yoonia sp. TaxID=2212373 RepID=UPI0032661981